MSDQYDRDHLTASEYEDEFEGEHEHELDEDASDESATEDGNDFIDMEAVESDNQSEDEFDEREFYSFPQFCLLPIELRALIWGFFDYDLKSKGRVMQVMVMESDLWQSAVLEQQTASARAMLATHKESRALALKSYPDTFTIRGGSAVIRCDPDQDIILLSAHQMVTEDSAYAITRQLRNIRCFAVDDKDFRFDGEIWTALRALENVKTVYSCFEASEMKPQGLQGFVSNEANKFYVQTTEEEPGLGEDLEFLYCWTRSETSPETAAYEFIEANPIWAGVMGTEIWPMVRFSFEKGLRYHDRIKFATLREGEWEDKWVPGSEADSEDGSAGSDDEDDDDEDESDLDGFIVDESLGEGEESTADEVEDTVVDQSSDEDHVSTFNGFSSPQDDTGLTEDDGITAARFSSLEPDPDPAGADDSDDSVVEVPPPIAKAHKRHIVSSEEEEDTDDDSEARKRQPRPTKRARIVLSDTEDEGNSDTRDEDRKSTKKQSRGTKRQRVVLSDSEDEDSVQEISPPARHGGDAAEEDERSQEDSDDDDGEEDSDEEPAKEKQMSLLARIQQFRSDVPVPDSGSDAESRASALDDDDARSDFQDDEDDKDVLELGGDEEYDEGEDAW
ncbi:Uu.00g140740.m01.CDS01 [Anthostomella pinea]|uniref:Uu.00g140740.m01.CDS01 n=1 Tax=Anthostomella pinea TaxID=933095 RepID=A0AAI8YLA5_9PEZI|nr:Uu.00g140740.m01.CDS01 [Anthostomella pinea]